MVCIHGVVVMLENSGIMPNNQLHRIRSLRSLFCELGR
jgi:hypothetical protein